MKRALSLLLVLGAVFVLCGCYTAPVKPPVGWAYSDVRAPLDNDLDQTQLGMKKGQATAQSVLGLVTWGDCSTQAAARAAGISTIRHADYRFYNVLGVYQEFTVTVYGD